MCPRSNVSSEKIHWTQTWPFGHWVTWLIYLYITMRQFMRQFIILQATKVILLFLGRCLGRVLHTKAKKEKLKENREIFGHWVTWLIYLYITMRQFIINSIVLFISLFCQLCQLLNHINQFTITAAKLISEIYKWKFFLMRNEK